MRGRTRCSPDIPALFPNRPRQNNHNRRHGAGVNIGTARHAAPATVLQAVQDQAVVAGKHCKAAAPGAIQISFHIIPVSRGILCTDDVFDPRKACYRLGRKSISCTCRDIVQHDGNIHGFSHGTVVVVQLLLAGRRKAGRNNTQYIRSRVSGHAGLCNGLPCGNAACARVHRHASVRPAQ